MKIKKFNENNKSMITIDIPVIDKQSLPTNIRILIDDKLFGDDILNAFQVLYLHDDRGSAYREVTKYFRDNGINVDRVLIDNTW